MQLTLHPQFPEHLAEAWNRLLEESISNLPFLRHEYQSTWWQTRGGGEWPQSAQLAVITAEKDGQLIGVAPLFLAEHAGRKTLLFVGSIEISDYLDLIVRPGDLAQFAESLLEYLAAGYPEAWQALDLYNLADGSPGLLALESAAIKHNWTVHQETLQPVPAIALPGDFETYLAGIDKKQRHEIRRKMRRAEESGRNVRWYILDDESRLDEEMEAFLGLMAQDPAKAEFLTEVMRTQMKQSAQAAFRAGWLQLAFLEVDGEKASAYLNFDYQNKLWIYNSGMDRRFMDLSVGWVLLGYLLQWANENKRREFDFMRGDEDYKFKFGGRPGNVARLVITR